MKSILLIVFIDLSSAPAFAQYQDSARPPTIRSTEFHAGLSTHKLAHIGLRQYLGSNLMIEGDMGAVSGIDRMAYSYNLGLGTILNNTKYEPGFYFSLNYTMITAQYRREQHLLAGNVGWLAQHSVLSVLGRAGIALFGNHEWFPFNLELTLGLAF